MEVYILSTCSPPPPPPRKVLRVRTIGCLLFHVTAQRHLKTLYMNAISSAPTYIRMNSRCARTRENKRLLVVYENGTNMGRYNFRSTPY